MNNQTLVIYDYKILYDILDELSDFINLNIINVKKLEEINQKKLGNYFIISKTKKKNLDNQILIDKTPIEIIKLIENINIKFLKKKFSQQSEINLGIYKLDLNSREIILNDLTLSLTEKETEMIIFIKSNHNVTIKELQNNVWGYSSNSETHTVETHIYRLRKKMKDKFGDETFIQNLQKGYKII